MSLRQGPQIGAADFNEVLSAGFNIPLDRAKPAPAAIAVPSLDVEPTGAFSGRMAAERRCMELASKKKRSEYYAHQIKGHWCVCERGPNREHTYVEG